MGMMTITLQGKVENPEQIQGVDNLVNGGKLSPVHLPFNHFPVAGFDGLEAINHFHQQSARGLTSQGFEIGMFQGSHQQLEFVDRIIKAVRNVHNGLLEGLQGRKKPPLKAAGAEVKRLERADYGDFGAGQAANGFGFFRDGAAAVLGSNAGLEEEFTLPTGQRDFNGSGNGRFKSQHDKMSLRSFSIERAVSTLVGGNRSFYTYYLIIPISYQANQLAYCYCG